MFGADSFLLLANKFAHFSGAIGDKVLFAAFNAARLVNDAQRDTVVGQLLDVGETRVKFVVHLARRPQYGQISAGIEVDETV